MVYYGLTATGIILLIWYYIVCRQAERPKVGTLEWIDRYERPCFAPESCGKVLCRADALWAALAAVLAAAASLPMHAGSAVYDGTLGSFLRFEIGGLSMHLCGETVCAALAAAAAYLFGKALTGSVFAAIAGALLFAAQPAEEVFAFFAFGGLLFLWLWAGYPRRGFASWALLLAGALFSGAAAFSFYFVAVAIAFVITLAVVLIYRVQHEICEGWHALLQSLAALVLAAVGVAAAAILTKAASITSPEFFAQLLAAFRGHWDTLLKEMTGTPLAARLPAVPLVLSGLVPLGMLWHSRRSGAALFLLVWALPLSVQYALVPAFPPMVTAAPICAHLTGRLLKRGHPVAARLGAIVAIAVVIAQVILWEILSVPF